MESPSSLKPTNGDLVNKPETHTHIYHSSSSSTSSLPPYTESLDHSTPTVQFQIHARGVTSCTSICKQDSASPILVFRVQQQEGPDGTESLGTEPEYISLRPKPSSNSCALVSGGGNSHATSKPVNATIYRWGPGRHPKIRVFSPTCSVSTIEQALAAEEDVQPSCEDIVEVHSRSLFSRDQRMEHTRFGTLQWRYASRAERKNVYDADSLLVLEKLDLVSGGVGGVKSLLPGKHKSKEENKESRVCVARFIRNAEFRTPGTTKSMAGNGGRLAIYGGAEVFGGEDKGGKERLEAFVIASCLCMLKKEVDRMRDNTTAAIA